mgnify:CR=1 FL=1
MNVPSVFRSAPDYEYALFRLLLTLPGHRGSAADIIAQFGERFREHIPQQHHDGRTRRGDALWVSYVHLGRYYLFTRGFLAPSPRGIWCLGEAGVQWAEQHPDADRLPQIRETDRERRYRAPTATATLTTGHRGFEISLEMLERTRAEMPEDLFKEIWGRIHEQVLAQERAKAVTHLSAREAGNRAIAVLNQVHAFLEGVSDQRPTAETLCDWIHFCFALDLHREAATLLRYVSESNVDAAIYRRAKRLSDASRARLGW